MVILDTSRFPLVIGEVRHGLSEADIRTLTDYMDERFKAKQRFAMVFDPTGLGIPNPTLLKEIAGWVRDRRQEMSDYCVGLALYLQSPALRGAMKFINRLAPPPNPQAIFGSLEETIDWARGQLADAGLTVPAA